MGKIRRTRQKYHASPKGKDVADNSSNMENESSTSILIKPPDNLFAGLDINSISLNKKLNDDIVSVKSFKSIKSELTTEKALTKKDKLKLRRELLMQKIDTVNQMKKEVKERKKRKNISIIGDTNPLHDALPSLESLLKRKNEKLSMQKPEKPKAVRKASQRKKKLLQNVDIYKKLLKSKDLKTNSLSDIAEHVKKGIKHSI